MRIAEIVKTAVLAMVLTTNYAAIAAEDFTPPEGAPFCQSRDELIEYTTALLKQDMAWVNSMKNCVLLKGNIHIGVIETEEGSDMGHVEKVRVFGKGGSSMSGYMLRFTLNNK